MNIPTPFALITGGSRGLGRSTALQLSPSMAAASSSHTAVICH